MSARPLSFIAALFIIAMTASSSASSSDGIPTSKEVPSFDASKCYTGCTDCLSACGDESSDTARADCERACARNAIGCCAAGGRRVTSNGACICGAEGDDNPRPIVSPELD